MESLIRYSERKLNKTLISFSRYLLDEIEWDDTLIGIKGAKGTGKTTIMLQRLKSVYGNSDKAMYVSLDNYYFTKNRLFDFAEEFYLMGGRALFLDEVHRYPTWSIEIKNLYDIYDDLKIVFSGSSALQLQKAEGDLSRRAAIYNLHELSFREYLELTGKGEFDKFSLKDILDNHKEIANSVIDKLSIIPEFRNYLKEGAYPFIKTAKGQVYDRLLNTLNVTIESELQIIEGINYNTAYKLRQLVAILSDSVPFKVNISDLSRTVGLSRDVLLRLLKALDRANLIKGIKAEGSAMGYLTKPDKIYLNNTNLLLALNSVDKNIEGTVRETFFMNQMIQAHEVKSSKTGDFIIDDKYLFEVGGAKKGFAQISNIKDSYIAADNIETGVGNKIPLWLFGFMY
ncbi:MAG: ATP-binding protein [Bacteroidales bacterium]|nr:ATP-binding protein [Bacteroidales bacterium]